MTKIYMVPIKKKPLSEEKGFFWGEKKQGEYYSRALEARRER